MPATSRWELEDLMQDIGLWNKFGTLRGIMGRRLRLLQEYLKAWEETE